MMTWDAISRMTDDLLVTIRQHFPHDGVADAVETLREALAASTARLSPGMRVAIAVGSRGIAGLPALVRETVRWVNAQQAHPFIVPAMGSHGGATAEGQQALLAGLGIAEQTVGAPICSSMDVVELPPTDFAMPVYYDRLAFAADATIVINRIKPHTSFHGAYESGLMKMLAIGLGKHRQALAIHDRGVTGLREDMPRVATHVLAHANVLLGIAVIENAHEEICHLEVVPAAEIPAREPALLALARTRMPRLPVEDIDLLIVDEMGKNISGLGIDPNVIGRLKIAGQAEPAAPRIRLIYVRDLTDASHGNATGMGLADLLTRRAADKIDFRATYANVTTTTFLERGKLPVVAETDAEALAIARRTLRTLTTAPLRIMRIQNTLRLDVVQVSPSLLDELTHRAEIDIIAPATPFFSATDMLAPFPSAASEQGAG